MLVSRIDAVFVPVLDIHRAVAWYGEVFGFVAAKKLEAEAEDTGLRLRGEAMPFLTLYKTDRIDPDAHFVFNLFAADAPALHRHMASRTTQITPISSNETMSWFEFRDCEGNWVGVCSYAE